MNYRVKIEGTSGIGMLSDIKRGKAVPTDERGTSGLSEDEHF